jgi:UDP-2-acetamido-2-deoxy-ribo-hexuluronate aminotransferase
MMLPIKMVDLHQQYVKIKEEVDGALLRVVESTNFINGSEVKNFCSGLETHLKVKHVIPCANGTDALQLALMALNIPAGSEVLVPSFSYIAAAEAIALLGFKPVFVDSQPDTFNIDPNKIEAQITEKTKAIIPIHLFGQSCDMLAIIKIAHKYNLYVIEDNAQSLNCDYYFPDETIKKAGTIGHIGTTSFFPSKNLGCMGDGGAIFTNDDAFADKLRTIANHGQKTKYLHELIGVNSRLDTLQAAVLNVKLKYLIQYTAARQKAATKYDAKFSKIGGVEIPFRSAKSSHVFHQYTLKIKNGKRDLLKEYLDQKGIPAMIYYPVPIHLQQAFSSWSGSKNSFPVAEQLSKEVISLPMHTELQDDQLTYICETIKLFF